MTTVAQLVRNPIWLFAAMGIALAPLTAATAAHQAPTVPQRDGARDFDWEFGAWVTNVRVLRNPLSGAAPDWAEFKGVSVVRPVLDGRSNIVELSVSNPNGKIEGVALRLYNPKTRQWNVNYAGIGNGTLTAPVYGGFDGKGRGLFYGQDMLDGRAILVRFVITQVSSSEARFEQSYSADGGASWETNWIAVDQRTAK